MGLMLDGVYLLDDPKPDTAKGGQFERARSTLRDPIPEGAEAGRLHLFAAWNCAWAHRALIMRAVLGFARTQEAYDEAVGEVFATLDKIEVHLSRARYLTGDALSEADIRLFPTLARFDVACHSAFKCNLKRVIYYPDLWAYAREIYQMPGVAETVKFDVYHKGYHSLSEFRNPLGIVPIGPQDDWLVPHLRR